jgi:hypothetical protein
MEFKAWIRIKEQEDTGGPPEATGSGWNRLWWHAKNQNYPLQAFNAVTNTGNEVIRQAMRGAGDRSDIPNTVSPQVPNPETKFPNLSELIQGGQIKEVEIRVPVTQDQKKMTNQAWTQFIEEVKKSYPNMLQPLQNIVNSGGTPDNFLRKEKKVLNGQAIYKFLLPTDPNLINALFS